MNRTLWLLFCFHMVAQMVKNPPTMQETWVQSLVWEDALEPTPGFLPGESHGQKSLACHSLWGCKELDMTEQLTRHGISMTFLIIQNIRTSRTFLGYYPFHYRLSPFPLSSLSPPH